MWYAKPSGDYLDHQTTYFTTEGIANAWEIYNILTGYNYTLEAICGVLGAVCVESGLNPWRWERDIYDQNNGYGLFQYTHAYQYINDCSGFAGYGPNLSVTQITSGAKLTDGVAQVNVMATNFLGKWVPACWRYGVWNPNTYPAAYAEIQTILQTYGTNNQLSQAQYAAIDNYTDAAIAFMGCFEGPYAPLYQSYTQWAMVAYQVLTGTPPQPPTPVYKKKKMPVWMMCGRKF